MLDSNHSPDPRDEYYMRQALLEAEEAARRDEVPVGAVITVGGRIIARSHNLTETLNDVTAHAEMMAITAAADALGGKYLPQCTLYVTVEPCPMCAGALGWSQIGRIVYGASDAKRGFTRFCTGGITPLHPSTSVTAGVLAEESARLMSDFFKKKRKRKTN
ncbi:MAG: nucleoside deaminase [Muribaculaceae bacterium]|nr:nucleoside deaminase [Muribaculaceae bacterium]MDE5713687.1 nucleoside deaminase [Muribaculaceae bacterium]